GGRAEGAIGGGGEGQVMGGLEEDRRPRAHRRLAPVGQRRHRRAGGLLAAVVAPSVEAPRALDDEAGAEAPHVLREERGRPLAAARRRVEGGRAAEVVLLAPAP